MNRRSFLKKCGLIPFVGSLAAVEILKSGPPGWTVFPEKDKGLKDAFVYGGKLFRVFPSYFDNEFTMIQLRENDWINRKLLLNSDFENLQHRHWACESMIRSLERKEEANAQA